MTLEEQLARIVERHDLSSLSINFYRRDDGTFWIGSYVHAAGSMCGSDNGSTAANDAIAQAIGDLNAKRFPPAIPELEVLAPMAEPEDGGE